MKPGACLIVANLANTQNMLSRYTMLHFPPAMFLSSWCRPSVEKQAGWQPVRTVPKVLGPLRHLIFRRYQDGNMILGTTRVGVLRQACAICSCASYMNHYFSCASCWALYSRCGGGGSQEDGFSLGVSVYDAKESGPVLLKSHPDHKLWRSVPRRP